MPRRITFATIFYLGLMMTCVSSSGQPSNEQKIIDSLHTNLRSAKGDTMRFKLLYEICIYYWNANQADSVLLYARQSYKAAEVLKSKKALLASLELLSGAYEMVGNVSKGLEVSLQSLRISEQIKDTLEIAHSLHGISVAYNDLEDLDQSISYGKRAYIIYDERKDKLSQLYSANVIGYAYLELKMPDSGLVYYQKAYEISNQIESVPDDQYALALYGLGRVNYQLGNIDISVSYYRKAIERLNDPRNSWQGFVLMLNYCGIADIFKDRGSKDSAVTYYNKALAAEPNVIKEKLNIYKTLSSLYEESDVVTAMKYLKLESRLRDSLFNDRNRKEAQTLTLDEQERQQQIVTQELSQKMARKRNIQYAAIAVGTIVFFILFLLLSRSIIVSTGTIRLLGIVGLLITFEFINLLIHPFLEKITHHSPLLMLVALVCIAALIVPFHHKLEKWMIDTLQVKNKKIRLAAAKKTIAELEPPPPAIK